MATSCGRRDGVAPTPKIRETEDGLPEGESAGGIRQPVNGSVEGRAPTDVNFQFMMPHAHWDGSPKTTTPSSLGAQLKAFAPM